MARQTVRTTGTASIEIGPALQAVIDKLDALGLNPTWGHVWRGSATLSFGVHVGGTEGVFGGVDVGATTGNLLSATVKYGNSGKAVQCPNWTRLLAELNKL